MILILLIILCIILVYTCPWIDSYTDYRGIKHLVLWYTNLKGERDFINLIGDRSN